MPDKHDEIALALQNDAKAKEKKEAERLAQLADVIDQIKSVVVEYKVPIKLLVRELGGIPSPQKGTKAPIKFKDSQGNKWSGRGKTPKWLEGKNPEDYRI